MPVTPTKNRQCFPKGKPKERFDTRREAAIKRDRLINSGLVAAGTIGAFECRHCSGFHIGHRRVDSTTYGRYTGRKKSGRRG